MTTPAADLFVGREQEMVQLAAALQGALAGQGRVVILEGEPGIGKTRVAEELSGAARKRGADVLWGRCLEEAGMPPLWPWAQVTRSYLRVRDARVVRSEMGASAAYLVHVEPELRTLLPDIDPAPIGDPESGRFRLYDSFANWLRRATASTPLLVVLDDLHWADAPSLKLLEFVAHELGESRALVLGTCRNAELTRTHPLSTTLGELTRGRHFLRLTLRGFDKREVGEVIGAAIGASPSADLIDAVHHQTEGNALFVREMVRWLGAEGVLTRTDARDLIDRGLRLPQGIREVIGRRLNGLSQACNSVLAVSSVLGQEFNASVLERVIIAQDQRDRHGTSASGTADSPRPLGFQARARGGSPRPTPDQSPHPSAADVIRAALDEAEAARLIQRVPDNPGGYSFTHALIQRTLEDELDGAVRTDLHGRIAVALEQRYGDHANEHAAELAHHFAAAASQSANERVIKYSKIAGERAIAVHDDEGAVRHFQTALAAKGDRPNDSEVADILFDLGRAQAGLGQFSEARQNLGRCLDWHADTGDVPGCVEIAAYPYTPAMTRFLTEEITRVHDLAARASYESGWFLINYAYAKGMTSGMTRDVEQTLKRAEEMALRDRSTALELRTLSLVASLEWFLLHWPECHDKVLRIIPAARKEGDLFAEFEAEYWAARCSMAFGDSEGARRHIDANLGLAERLRDRWLLSNALAVRGSWSHFKGEWDTAREYLGRASRIPIDAYVVYPRVLIEFESGNSDEGAKFLQAFIERGESPANKSWVLGLVSHILDTQEWLVPARENAALASSWPPVTALEASMGAALIAIRDADPSSATRPYDNLSRMRGFLVMRGIVCDRLLGLLATTMGRSDDAAVHFRDSLAFCRRAGYEPELGWTCHDYAQMLVGTGKPDDRHQATLLIDEGLAIARRLTMRPLEARLDRLAATASTVGHRRRYPDGLTEREVETLRLIAAGKSNREIAEALVISENTVIRHVSNILGKIRAANRAEASAYAVRHGLSVE